MRNFKYVFYFIMTVFLSLSSLVHVKAQSGNDLELRLKRNFGYSSGTGKIQGTITMIASGPDDLVLVEFQIDDQIIGQDDEVPFEHKFNTGDFSLGVHTLRAIGHTSGGRVIYSNEQRREFVPLEEVWRMVGSIFLIVFGLIAIAMVASIIIPLITGRKKPATVPLGAPRNYGLLGGAICPKCQRPYGVHIWGMNLVIGKMDRCPHCKKWSIVRRAPLEMLRAAEAAELEHEQEQSQAPASSEEDLLRKQLDDSRYQDL